VSQISESVCVSAYFLIPYKCTGLLEWLRLSNLTYERETEKRYHRYIVDCYWKRSLYGFSLILTSSKPPERHQRCLDTECNMGKICMLYAWFTPINFHITHITYILLNMWIHLTAFWWCVQCVHVSNACVFMLKPEKNTLTSKYHLNMVHVNCTLCNLNQALSVSSFA